MALSHVREVVPVDAATAFRCLFLKLRQNYARNPLNPLRQSEEGPPLPGAQVWSVAISAHFKHLILALDAAAPPFAPGLSPTYRQKRETGPHGRTSPGSESPTSPCPKREAAGGSPSGRRVLIYRPAGPGPRRPDSAKPSNVTSQKRETAGGGPSGRRVLIYRPAGPGSRRPDSAKPSNVSSQNALYTIRSRESNVTSRNPRGQHGRSIRPVYPTPPSACPCDGTRAGERTRMVCQRYSLSIPT